jgi:hypothetical protein
MNALLAFLAGAGFALLVTSIYARVDQRRQHRASARPPYIRST